MNASGVSDSNNPHLYDVRRANTVQACSARASSLTAALASRRLWLAVAATHHCLEHVIEISVGDEAIVIHVVHAEGD